MDWRLTPANHIAGKVQALDGLFVISRVLLCFRRPKGIECKKILRERDQMKSKSKMALSGDMIPDEQLELQIGA